MRSTATRSEGKFREAAKQLRTHVAGIRAVVLIGPEGDMVDYTRIDPEFDVETFASEYATLLRIARRTSEDTGSGELIEHVTVSAHSITLARIFGQDAYLVLVSNVQDQIGRARYELKKAARTLEPGGPAANGRAPNLRLAGN